MVSTMWENVASNWLWNLLRSEAEADEGEEEKCQVMKEQAP
jgi:hypothetical protein